VVDDRGGGGTTASAATLLDLWVVGHRFAWHGPRPETITSYIADQKIQKSPYTKEWGEEDDDAQMQLHDIVVIMYHLYRSWQDVCISLAIL